MKWPGFAKQASVCTVRVCTQTHTICSDRYVINFKPRKTWLTFYQYQFILNSPQKRVYIIHGRSNYDDDDSLSSPKQHLAVTAPQFYQT